MGLNLRIVQWRRRFGLTQGELAEKCSTTQQSIAKIEQGAVDPKLSTLQRIADALDLEIVDLFYTHEDFAHDVNAIAEKYELNLSKVLNAELNNLCWKESSIPPFHPFWSEFKIKNNKVTFKKGDK